MEAGPEAGGRLIDSWRALFFYPFSKATAWRAQGWLHITVPGPEPTILMCTGVERRGILVQNIGSNAKTTSFAQDASNARTTSKSDTKGVDARAG